MHFRFRGNSIQIVKSQNDQETGKAKSVPLGSINRASLLVSDKLRANCSPSELQEIETWVKGYQSVVDLKNKHAALTLSEQMGAAIGWFEKADQAEARQAVDDILATWALLRAVLNKHGLL